jgi:hypothetical protein
MKRLALGLLLLLGVAWCVLSVVVEREGQYVFETLGVGTSHARALILYHPSRDAGFSDDLSLAFAQGLQAQGVAVDRATLTSDTPADPQGYSLVAVVTNTYYWTPDLPTLHYLERAHLTQVRVVGLIGGAGSTGRAQRVLETALRQAGATAPQTRPFWLWRPNDEARPHASNRDVALDLAKQFGLESAKALLPGDASQP